MVTQLILVGLLSLCGLSFGEECNRVLKENVDFPGTDFATLRSPDVEHCQQLCTQHASCLFFTFVRPDWTRDSRHFYCYLKSTPTGKPKVESLLLGVTSGYSLKPCSKETLYLPQPCLSKVYQNVDFLGADYRTFFTTDHEECQRACTRDPGCQFFTFVNSNFTPENIRYKCHLKFSWNIIRTPVVERKTGVTSGFSRKIILNDFIDTACQNKFFQSTDIPGQDFENLPASSAEHCQALCSAHPRCTYFSFISDSFTCHLKNNPNTMVINAKAGVTSGMPARFCQLDTKWLEVAHGAVDFRGSDIRFEIMDDADQCQRTCSEEPTCQFYTYVHENFGNSAYRKRCYLKRVTTMPAPPQVNKLNNVVSGFSLRSCVV